MNIKIRSYNSEDAPVFVQIHYDSVHGLAQNHYSQDILDAWSPPVDESRINHFIETSSEEIRILAEVDGVPAGYGSLIIARREVKACYVSSGFSRMGIGTRILKELEKIAKDHHLINVFLDASLNAVYFYEKNNYRIIKKADHPLGGKIYKMKKEIA